MHFIQEFGVPNYPPFLSEEPGLTPKPAGYDQQLSVVKEFLRQKVYFVDEERREAATPVSPEEERALLDRVKKQEKPEQN
jgi:hypothetical protein